MIKNEETANGSFDKAADRFFSIYPGSHGFILLLYLRKTKCINIIDNAEADQPYELARMDLNYISTLSYNVINSWRARGIYSQSIIADISDNPQLQKAFDYIVDDMLQKRKNYDPVILFDIINYLKVVDDDWFDRNYLLVVDRYIRRVQGYNFRDLYFQPIELTKIIVELSEYKGGKIYNPFAGVASFGRELNARTNYYGQEVMPLVWSLGLLELLGTGIDTSNFKCEDSIQNWTLLSPSLIIASPPFGLRVEVGLSSTLNSNIFENNVLVEHFFIRRGLESLDSKGKLVGVFPLTVLNGQNFDIEFLDTVVLMPKNLFYSTSVSTVILMFNKGKADKSAVRMIDGSSYFEKNDRMNILKWEELLQDIKINNTDILRFVSHLEIEQHDKNLSPILYINEKQIKEHIPIDHRLIKLKELLDSYSCQKSYFKESRVITGKDLASDKFAVEKTFESLPSESIRDSVYYLNRDLLLTISSGQNLKPTYFKKTEGIFVGYIQNILAYTIQEKKVLPGYLINELSKEYVTRQITALFGKSTIPYFAPEKLLEIEIYIPNLSKQKELLDKEKVDYFSLKLKEANLEIEQIKNAKYLEYAQNISQRKHAISQVLNDFESSFNLISDRLIQNGSLEGSEVISSRSGETVNNYFTKIKMTVTRLLDLVDVLNDNKQYGEPELIWLGSFLDDYCNNRLLQNFRIEYQQDIAENDLILPEVKFNGEILGGVMHRKGDKLDLYAVSISRRDLTQMLDNIISNAKKHGFDNKNRNDYCIRIILHKKEIDGISGVAICISNNGSSLPKGMSKENVFIWGASSSNSTGIGLYQVRNIVEYFGGTAELNVYPKEPSGFSLEYEIVLPIVNTN